MTERATTRVVSHRMTEEEFQALRARAKELGVPQSRLMGALIMGVEPGYPQRLAALEKRVERLECP